MLGSRLIMKILTWNINGIRASKRCLRDVLDSLNADVICLQETKITRDMLDEPSAIVDGYNAYFSFSRKRSGYSGTANFCRDAVMPTAAEEGLSGQLSSQSEGSVGCLGNNGEFAWEELQSLDGEGRAIITQHQIELENGTVKDLAIINVYVPRAADRDDRWTYKLRFLALLQSRAESLLRHGRSVIVLGDVNTSHKRIDHCDPSCQEFLREGSRRWLDQFLRAEDRDPELAAADDDTSSCEAILPDAEGGHFIDAFRFFYPDQKEAYTNWSTVTSARQTNYGKRLDYILVDMGLQEFMEDCQILADFEGSDHCPVVLQLRCKSVAARKCPPLCTKYMPEFQGKQQTLLTFFSKRKTVDSERKEAQNVASCDKPRSDSEKKGAESMVSCDKPRSDSEKKGAESMASCDKRRSDSEKKGAESMASCDKQCSDSEKKGAESMASCDKQRSDSEKKGAESMASCDKLCSDSEKKGAESMASCDKQRSDSEKKGAESMVSCDMQCQKGHLKRTSSDKTWNSSGRLKKKKIAGKGDNYVLTSTVGGGKQASLLSFFHKPASKSSVTVDKPASRSSVTVDKPAIRSPMSVGKPAPVSACVDDNSPSVSLSLSSVSDSCMHQTVSKYWGQGGDGNSDGQCPCKLTSSSSMPPSTGGGLSLLPSLKLIPQSSSAASAHSPHVSDALARAESQGAQQELCESESEGQGLGLRLAESEVPVTGEAEPSGTSASASCLWKGLLSGPPPPPPCRGHKEPCVLRTVKKAGPNKGKQFYVCARPQGHKDNKEARCDHFQWVSKKH